MSNYTKQISWSGKDALSDSDSEKVISGGDFDTEFSAVQTAINSKIDGGTITNFTSTGIDDNATSTAITIDASENVGIGTTSPVSLLHVHQVGTANAAVIIERATGNTATLTSGASTGFTIDSDNTNGGEALTRFTQNGTEKLRIQAAGGISFNGDTAAANALDDYEEGTWTPTLITAGASFTENNSGTYTKIGRVVTISGVIILTSVTAGSGNYQVGNLPYTPATPTTAYEYYNSVFTTGSLTTNSDGIGIHSNTNCYFISDGATSAGGAAAGTTVFKLTYIT